MKKSKFLKEVMTEINHLRNNATPEEKDRLDFESFIQTSSRQCIYGQMTGHCNSIRAKELYPKTYYYIKNKAGEYHPNGYLPFSKHEFKDGDRVTPLEKYLYMCANRDGTKSKTHRHIIDYIKGNRKTLKLA